MGGGGGGGGGRGGATAGAALAPSGATRTALLLAGGLALLLLLLLARRRHPGPQQRPEVEDEGLGDVGARRGNEFVGHQLGVRRHLVQGREAVVHRIEAGAMDGHRAVAVVPQGELRRLLPHLARLALVDVGDAADERALQVAKGVGAHPLDLQVVLHLRRQEIPQGGGAGELDVAVRVGLALLRQAHRDRHPLLVHHPLAYRHHAATVLLVNALHVGEEVIHREGTLGQIDQVRAIVRVLAPEGRGGGEKAGVAPHHHPDVDAGDGAVVHVGADEGRGHEARRRRIAGAVVVHHQVVVDRLRDVDGAELVVRLLRLVVDDPHRVRRVVAADVEEVARAVRLQDPEDLLAVGRVRLVAGRADRRRRRLGHPLQVVGGLLGEVDELLVDDPGHPVQGAVDVLHLGKLARLQHRPHEGLVDHRGGPAAHGHHHLAYELFHRLPPPVERQRVPKGGTGRKQARAGAARSAHPRSHLCWCFHCRYWRSNRWR